MLLAVRPAHGYELKTALERHLGGVLPALNDGQVYTTLSRLERDGLVEAEAAAHDARGKRIYALTERGRQEARAWLTAPAAEAKVKDEFFVKLALAASTGMGDPVALIEAHREATLRSLRGLDARTARADDPVPELLREGVALLLQARLRWLDLCEDRLTTRTERTDGSRR